LHKLPVYTATYKSERAQIARACKPGEWRGELPEVDYLNTERDLGVILEVFSGMPE